MASERLERLKEEIGDALLRLRACTDLVERRALLITLRRLLSRFEAAQEDLQQNLDEPLGC